MKRHAPTPEEVNTLYETASKASRADVQKVTDNALEFIYTLEQTVLAGGPSREWLGWFHRDSEEVIKQLDGALLLLNTLRHSLHTVKANAPSGKPHAQTLDIDNDETLEG